MSDNSKIKIIPLGGLEEIGMNMTAFEYNDGIIVVDCGLSFPSDDMLGIDCVIPDITFWSRRSYWCITIRFERNKCTYLRNKAYNGYY